MGEGRRKKESLQTDAAKNGKIYLDVKFSLFKTSDSENVLGVIFSLTLCSLGIRISLFNFR
jgi:hypothetical protein